MSNYSKIYWLTRLDNIQFLFALVTAFAIVTLVFYFIAMSIDSYDADDRKEFDTKYKTIRRLASWILIPCLLVCTFLPSKDEMILIWVGGKTMNFVQSDSSLSKIPYQATSIISQYMDKTLKDLQTENK